MRLTVLAIGRMMTGPELALAEDYLSRVVGLGPKAGITGIRVLDQPESRAPTASQRMAEEARFLTGKSPAGALLIALDAGGKTMGSEEFARLLRRHAETGSPDLAFLIGGPDGMAADVRERAGLTLSLGPMTWPHRLVRVMLLEQIYRAVTIMVNHPYHRA